MEAWRAFRDGASGLIQVATGTGKTLAAYLGALAELIDELDSSGALKTPVRGSTLREGSHASAGSREPQNHGTLSLHGCRRKQPTSPALRGIRILYVTPLRAVSRDIELALKEPVESFHLPISVESRTGDTKASVRAKQKERLPNVLITTPESLSLLLTREDAAEKFATLRCAIVDEWHELLSSKRGTQTELALARLRRFAPEMRTWALSATLPNVEVAARAATGTECSPRIIQADMPREVVIDSVLPENPATLPWAGHLGLAMLPEVLKSLDPTRPTLLFTNTRSQAERWYHAILVQRPDWAGIMSLHHGSIDRAERERVERGLKDGSVRLVVATSSLDLGVDFSPVERVYQIGSPKGIARLTQRAGRASHKPMTPCRVTCVPTYALELIEIAAVKRAIARDEMEPRLPHEKPLDVLSQHLVTCALGGGFDPDSLFDEVRSTWSYRNLTREEFDWALALVENGGGTLAAYPQFHRVRNVDGRRRVPDRRLGQLHRLNVGTITADSTIDVRYLNGRSLGRIEEHFISGLHEGEKFVFAGKVLKFVMLHDMAALVRPAVGSTNYTPVWSGTKLPISESLSSAIRDTFAQCARGRFDGPELEAARRLVETQKRLSALPGTDEVLAEIIRTREGCHLFLYPFEGRLVHGGLASLIALRLTRLAKATFSVAANDYGFEILSPDEFSFGSHLSSALFTRAGLMDDAAECVNTSQLAQRQFREIARIAGLVIQNHPGAPRTARQLQASSSLLFDVLTEFDRGNLLLHQARREVLEKQFEFDRLSRTLARIEKVGLTVIEPNSPTPLAFPLMIERLAARHSSETISDRIRRMQLQWDTDVSNSLSTAVRSA